MHDIVIIGGGVAGLSAANTLVDQHVYPLIIESGQYLTHKVCGEFLSAECLPLLDRWGLLSANEITSLTVSCGTRTLSFPLPAAAQAQARYRLDNALAQRAVSKGAILQTETQVVQVKHKADCYHLHLSNGDTVQAKQMIVSTGRLAQGLHRALPPGQVRYIGIKLHMKNVPMEQKLILHTLLKGGYAGCVPIDKGTVNIAALLPLSLFQNIAKEDYYQHFLMLCPPELQTTLSQGQLLFCLHGFAPAFGIKQTPQWPHAYFIGDATGTIPPAAGAGLSLGLYSGCMAAHYALQKAYEDFRLDWKKRYQKQFFAARLLHRIMLSPALCEKALKVCHIFPFLAATIFHFTRTKTTAAINF